MRHLDTPARAHCMLNTLNTELSLDRLWSLPHGTFHDRQMLTYLKYSNLEKLVGKLKAFHSFYSHFFGYFTKCLASNFLQQNPRIFSIAAETPETQNTTQNVANGIATAGQTS